MTPSSALPVTSLGFCLAALLCACDVEVTGLEVEDSFLLDASPVDILWVVDNSSSMAEAQASLGATFPSVHAELAAAGLDWQMGIVTTDMSDPDGRGRLVPVSGDGTKVMTPLSSEIFSRFALRIQVGTGGSPVERGLETSWAAVTPPLATHDNIGFLRPDTRLAIVVVSDDDDCSHEGDLPAETGEACVADPGALVPVSDYLVRYQSMKDDPVAVTLHALVETGTTSEFEGCGGSTPGTRAMKLARSTGGAVFPLCELEGWASELGRQLAGRRTAFPLSRSPDPDTLIVDLVAPQESQDDLGQPDTRVEEDRTRQSGWTWHGGSNSLRLWGEAVPDLGWEVRIRYSVGSGQ
ncbi:MAG: hypothetical protein VX498_01270 [Myxococcota bacterium]|nr:hypothetical protein [Myxococcota bacterium]